MDAIFLLSTIFYQADPSPNPNPAPSTRVLLTDPMTHVQPPVTSPVPHMRVPPVTSPLPPPRVPPHTLLPCVQPHMTSPVPSLRVPSRAPHPRTQPHVIELYHDIDNFVDDIVPPRYALRSHRPIPALSKRIPHYIATCLQSNPPIPAISPQTSARHVMATRLLLAAEARKFASSTNAVIYEVTGKSLDYRHFLTGPNKDVWTHSSANNLDRIAQGIGTRMPNSTSTVFLFVATIPRTVAL